MPEKWSFHVLCGAGHCPGQYTQSFNQKRPSPREACYRGESWCSVGGWGFLLAPPVHSSPHCDGTPYHDLKDRGYRPWVGCTHLSVSSRGAHEHDHHCETTWSEIHHWRHSASSAWHTFCAFSLTHDGVACDPTSPDVYAKSQQPAACLQCSEQPPPKSANHHTQLRGSEMKRLSLIIRFNCCLLGLWLVSSDTHASANVADQCLGCVAKFCWRILATHPTFLSLLDEKSPQPTSLQYTPAFALANYAARCPQRMIENAKLFCKKHIVLNRQSARQTSPKVAATWMTSIPMIPVSPDTVLSALTIIHHSLV